MKKIIAVAAVLIIIAGLMGMAGCRDRNAAQPGPEPTATMTPTPLPPLLVEDFTSGVGSNALGGIWFTYGDGGSGDTFASAAASPGYNASGYCLNFTGSTSASCGYGSWLVTTLNSGATEVDISMYSGIRFYAKDPGGANYRVALLSGAAGDNYQFTFTAPTAWSQVVIPFSVFTQAAPDSTTIAQSLAREIRIAWPSGACPETVNLFIDHIELYI